ncbi:MAG: ECF transporter S component [Saccharofermentanales bacterium]
MPANKKILGYLIPILAIPLVIVAGVTVFKDRQFAFISLAVAVLACVPFFMAFENKKNVDTKKIVILAVMIALSVLGRFVFAFVPFFKPVTAIVVIVAIYFGPEMGFLCGAMSALVSNFYFGQGPWTPFQMFAWGLIGFIAGLLGSRITAGRIRLVAYGVFAGIFYSLAMDVWAVLWIDGAFNLSRYIAALITALPVTAVYAVSNVIFLLMAERPLGKKLNRIKVKYGL